MVDIVFIMIIRLGMLICFPYMVNDIAVLDVTYCSHSQVSVVTRLMMGGTLRSVSNSYCG